MRRGLLGVVACLLLWNPVPASAAWSPGQRLDSGAQSPVAVGNARGDRVAAWSTGAGIRIAVAEPGKSFGRARTLAGSQGGVAPLVAVSRSGAAAIAWSYVEGCGRIRWVSLSARGKASRVRTAADCDVPARLLAVAVSSSGGEAAVLFGRADAADAWVHLSSGVPQQVAPRPGVTAGPSTGALAFDAERPRVLWQEGDRPNIVESTRGRTRWPAAKRSVVLRDAPGNVRTRIVATPGGHDALSWLGRDETTFALTTGGGTRVAGRGWKTAVLARLGETGFEAPSVAVGDRGVVVFAWRSEDWDVIRTAVGPTSDGPGPPVDVWQRTGAEMADCTSVGVGPTGRILHVFSTFVPGAPQGLVAVLGAGDGGPVSRATIDPVALSVECDRPTLNVDSKGRGSAVWLRDGVVFAARGR